MIDGLTVEENEFLFQNLINPLKGLGCRVFLFGSRATKSFQKFSDIDLLYRPTISDVKLSRTIYQLLSKIEDSRFPFKIDLVGEADLAAAYRSKVEAERIEL